MLHILILFPHICVGFRISNFKSSVTLSALSSAMNTWQESLHIT